MCHSTLKGSKSLDCEYKADSFLLSANIIIKTVPKIMLAHSTMNKHYSLGELTRMEDGREEQSETIKEARTFPTFRPSLSNRMPNKQLYRLLHGCPVAALLQGSHQFGVGRAHHTGAEQPRTLPVPTHGCPYRHTSSTRPTMGVAKAFQSNTFCFVFVVFGQQKLCARCSEPPSRTKTPA